MSERVSTQYLLSLNVIGAISLAIFLGSAIFTAYELGYAKAEVNTIKLYSSASASHMDSMNPIHRIRIVSTLCMAIGVIGIWVKRPVGLLVSLVGCVGVLMSYLWWYRVSKEILKGAEITTFPPDIVHIGPLMDAVRWDIGVLIVIACFTIWISKILLDTFRERG